MSYILTALRDCPNLQDRLNDWFAIGDHGRGVLNEPMPFLQFVTQTDSALDMRVAPGRGKLRTVEVLYDQYLTEDNVDSNVTNPDCTSGEEVGNFWAQYEMDPDDNVAYKESMSREHLMKACVDNADYFARRLQAAINVVDRRVATKTATQVLTLTGTWNETEGANIDGATFTDDQLVLATKTSAGDPNPYTHEILDAALMTSLFDSNTFIVGGMELYQHFRRVQAGCCTNAGIDISQIQALYGYAVAYDKRIQAAFASSDVSLALRGGALSLLNYNVADWKDDLPSYIEAAGNYVQFVVNSPATGLPYDVTITDDCGVITWQVAATTKLVGIPEDLFPAGEYEGLKWVNEIKVTNP